MARVNINQPVHYKDDNHQSNFPALVNELSFRGLAMQFIKPAATPATFFLSGTTIVAPNLVNVQNGWFCQQEWKFEKTTRLPLKLRLGSMDAVDYLEGKHIRR